MSEVRMYIAMSLDGYIATPEGDVDWLEPYPAGDVGYAEFLQEIGSIVMGRRTYEQVTTMGEWPYGSRPTYVLSSRRIEPVDDSITWADDGLPSLLARLHGTRRDIWILGGAETIHRAFLGDHLDRLEVFVIPTLLGSGMALFSWAAGPRTLDLIEATAFDNGVVKLDYRLQGK